MFGAHGRARAMDGSIVSLGYFKMILIHVRGFGE
jgi:hypothetical protein